MKKLPVVLLIWVGLVTTNLKAQHKSTSKIQSFEFHLGLRHVSTSESENIIYSLNNPPFYEGVFSTDKGVKVNSRISSNWTFNNKHEVILGGGLNIWRRKSFVTSGDVLSNWYEGPFSDHTIFGQVDLITGYRYFFLLKNGKDLFLENVFHAKLYSGKFPGIKFNVEPGIGVKLRINEKYNFISVFSYKQPLGDAQFTKVFQKNVGLRFGLSKVM